MNKLYRVELKNDWEQGIRLRPARGGCWMVPEACPIEQAPALPLGKARALCREAKVAGYAVKCAIAESVEAASEVI